MIWSNYEIETLERMWANHSASEIGRVLGRSRNSVIGKAGRLKLKKGIVKTIKQIPINVRKTRQASYIRNVKPAIKKVVDRKQAALITFRDSKKLIDLKQGECCWPLGEGKDMMFCACQVKEGKSYCEEHYKLATRPNNRKIEKFSKYTHNYRGVS